MVEGLKILNKQKEFLSLGVEKLALSSSIINNLDIIDIISAEIGAQSVCAVLDVKKEVDFLVSIIFTQLMVKRNLEKNYLVLLKN